MAHDLERKIFAAETVIAGEKTQSEMARIFGVNPATISSWVSKYQNNDLKAPKRKVCPDALREFLVLNPQAKIRDIARSFDVSVPYVQVMLKRIGAKKVWNYS